ncbi:hypothetical protein AFV9_gp19 [Betalipothrixvirus uzonense]|uniref:Uncharacterized protein n=1 Tax=Betalipothrixvirus uzonense TaxID=512792 RepID=B2CRJ6_9VIRU|nr:hypothetical protein AFV9_gp19 [Acidianus filamentous virus 9]ACB37253.1 hypothetical protein [Acidianus filamentous virus 9]
MKSMQNKIKQFELNELINKCNKKICLENIHIFINIEKRYAIIEENILFCSDEKKYLHKDIDFAVLYLKMHLNVNVNEIERIRRNENICDIENYYLAYF